MASTILYPKRPSAVADVMADTLSGNDRDWIACLFDLAMAELKHRRPDLREKSESEILETLTDEYGPPEQADLAEMMNILGEGFAHIDPFAEALGGAELPRSRKMRNSN